MTNKLICFVGVMGSGKDYNAKKYIEENPNTVHINFADELREMAWDILGVKFEGEQYDKFKEGTLNFQYFDQYMEDSEQLVTGREFLQHLGTEALRKRDCNFWVKCWVSKVQEALNAGKDIVCSDLRFDNELRFALGINYSANLSYPAVPYFVFCNYISDRYDSINTHESEKFAQTLLKDGFNDGEEITIEYLRDMMCNCVDLS